MGQAQSGWRVTQELINLADHLTMQQRQGVDRRLHFAADALLNVLAHCLPLRQV